MAMSEINYGENSIVDLASDTVTEETLLKGVTAHDATGAPITGTMHTVPDSTLLGGKAPEYYLTPVNLLDNSWFGGRYLDGVKKGLVYQAGLNGTHGTTKYPMDRWISWTADVAFADGYITPGSPIDQRIDLNRIDASKTYTAAICLSDGTIKCESGTPSSTFGSYGLGIYAPAMDNSGYWYVRLNTGLNIRWVALYEGKYTAETLPPYVPKPYAVELAECQRYYRRLEHTSNKTLFPTIAYNTKSLYGSLHFAFRAKPTIIVSNVVFCKSGISSAKTVVSCNSVGTGEITSIMVTLNEGDAVTGDTYNIWTSINGGYMELSADL